MKKTNRGLILIGLIAAMLLYALDQTVVATAMPQIVRELNGLSHLSWVFTAYMLTATVTVPIYGKLSDIYGRKGLLIVAIAVFMIGSILSGLSQNMTQLILFRGLQGIGAGAMMVDALSVIGDLYAPRERGKYQGLMMGVMGLGTIIGPLLGGWLTDNYSWRWVFYINVPVAVVAIAILSTAMPKIARDVKAHAIDFTGALLMTAGLVPLLLALVWAGSQYAWGSWQIIATLCVSGAALFAFALVEQRVREPLLSLNLFQNRVFTVSAIVTFLTSAVMFGGILYITLFAQGVVGMSATNSGLILMPLMIGVIFSSIVVGLLISRIGKYKILTVIGMAVGVLGMFLFTQLSVNTTQSDLYIRMVVLGLGLGVTLPVFTIVVQAAFGMERLGEVTAGVALFRSLGGAVGPAVLGGIMNAQLASRLTAAANDPFVNTIKQFNPNISIDANTAQGLLSPAGQAQIRAALTQAPAPMQAQLIAGFDHFLNAIKSAFSSSLDQVFIIGTILMAVAFVVVLFLPERPLRRTNPGIVAEAGIEPDAGPGATVAKD